MDTLNWQKSSFCGEGDSCLHVAATPETIHITESGDPTGAILTTTPTALATLLTTLKAEPLPADRPTIQVTTTEDGTVHIHTTEAPHTVVTTDHPRWKAFVLGVQAGEFDHFAEAK